MTFFLAPGQYTYTAQALPGGSAISTIGLIPMTVVAHFPLSIPLTAAFATFDNYQTDVGVDTPNSFIYFGTPTGMSSSSSAAEGQPSRWRTWSTNR